MMDKLGLYINNLMATIVDKEEKHFVRKLAFTELQKLNHDIGDFLIRWDKEFDEFPTEEQREENEKQLIMEFGEKNERTD
jgi:hypothetical protein|tara:strand:- start:17 stop:256 length:240 start_codon:yes stop_codon:yes gene_type:complete